MIASDARPIFMRCVCDQYGRCLVDCPSADLVRPCASSYYDRRRGVWVDKAPHPDHKGQAS